MKNSLSSSKKANALSWFSVIIILFVTGFITIIAYLVLDNFIDEMDTQGYLEGPAENAAQGFLNGLRVMDYIIVLVMIVLILGVAITSYTIATKKVFFILTILFSAFYGFISYFFNYIFQQMVSQAQFSSVIGFFPNTILICSNLHWVMLANIIIGSIALYAKEEKGQYVE